MIQHKLYYHFFKDEKEIKISEEEVQLTLTKFRQEFQQKQREVAQRKAQEAAAAEEVLRGIMLQIQQIQVQ